MAKVQTFGRRGAVQPRRPAPPSNALASAPNEGLPAAAGPQTILHRVEAGVTPSVDDELREWKRARRAGVAIPWRPLSFMASFCFGLASFVLPDSINDVMQWPLYALAAASFYAGVKARRKKREIRSAEMGGAAA